MKKICQLQKMKLMLWLLGSVQFVEKKCIRG